MFLSNRETIDHSTALIVDPLRGPSLLGDIPTSVKFPIITGSQILFSNVTFLHATPEREILRSDKFGDSLSTEIGKKVYYGKIANITSKSLPQSVVDELTQTSQRSFIRVQYSTRPIEDYTATSSFFPIHDKMISEILLYLGDGSMLDSDTTNLVESKKELNDLLIGLVSVGATFGGKKTLKKKNKKNSVGRGHGSSSIKIYKSNSKTSAPLKSNSLTQLKVLDLNKIYGKQVILNFTHLNKKNIIIKMDKSNVISLSKYETANTIIY